MDWRELQRKLIESKYHYFHTDNGILLCGDCIEILKTLPDKSVDLTLTDPPYALGKEYDTYEDTEENLKSIIKEFMPQALRVSKVMLLTCGLTNISLYPPPRWILAWIYKTTNSRGKWGFAQWQPILAYGVDPYLREGLGARSDVIEATGLDNQSYDHPCPKPLKFWERLLLRGSPKEGEIVLDPFGGTGVTAVACEKYNRRWIAIEISEKYCEITQERVLGRDKYQRSLEEFLIWNL